MCSGQEARTGEDGSRTALACHGVLTMSTIDLIMSTATTSQLNDVLFGQTRGRILALLYGTPDQQYYIRQIARHVGTSPGNVQRELETLREIGLIERSTIGNVVLFQANPKHPVFREIRALIAKTAGSFHVLRTALEPLAPRISFAFVYGSVARGEEDASSDVDLMVVGKVTLDELLAHLTPVEEILGRSINPTVYSLREFKSKLQADNHFLRSIVRGKNVFLIGAENDLRKVG
jgi:predicted nucleotidyltransferase